MSYLDLLTPENCQVISIDQQPQMAFGVQSIDRRADPARAASDALPQGVRPAPRARSNGEMGPTPAATMDGAWGTFRAHLSAFSARRFHQISFPGEVEWCGRRESNPRVCARATHGSAIELRTLQRPGLVHRAGLEPAKPGGRLIYSQASLPLE